MKNYKLKAIAWGIITGIGFAAVASLNTIIEPLFTAQEAVKQLEDSNTGASSFKMVPILFDVLYIIPIITFLLTFYFTKKGLNHE